MPINHDKALGQAVADFLHLKPIATTKRYKDPHYKTTWGTKPLRSLGASIRRQKGYFSWSPVVSPEVAAAFDKLLTEIGK